MGVTLPLGRHGAAYHWDDMGRHCIVVAYHWDGIGRHCIVAACGNIALWQHGAALDWGSKPLGRDGVAYHWDGMLCWNYQIWHCQIAAIILVAKHLGENTKNPALTYPTFTAASHFARIPKSSIAKFHQLYWRQTSNYTGSKLAITLTKIQHS